MAAPAGQLTDHPAAPGRAAEEAAGGVLRRPTPGALWRWVKVVSWIELTLFAALCFFWLAPGFPTETMIFGTAHGVGWIALCLFIWFAILRRQAPYVLLAATMTPVGPLGSVIAIELIERRRPEYRKASPERGGGGGTAGGRGSTRPAPTPARR